MIIRTPRRALNDYRAISLVPNGQSALISYMHYIREVEGVDGLRCRIRKLFDWSEESTDSSIVGQLISISKGVARGGRMNIVRASGPARPPLSQRSDHGRVRHWSNRDPTGQARRAAVWRKWNVPRGSVTRISSPCSSTGCQMEGPAEDMRRREGAYIHAVGWDGTLEAHPPRAYVAIAANEKGREVEPHRASASTGQAPRPLDVKGGSRSTRRVLRCGQEGPRGRKRQHSRRTTRVTLAETSSSTRPLCRIAMAMARCLTKVTRCVSPQLRSLIEASSPTSG